MSLEPPPRRRYLLSDFRYQLLISLSQQSLDILPTTAIDWAVDGDTHFTAATHPGKPFGHVLSRDDILWPGLTHDGKCWPADISTPSHKNGWKHVIAQVSASGPSTSTPA